MKKYIFYIVTLLLISACSTTPKTVEKETKTEVKTATVDLKYEKTFNNPVFFYKSGTSFGLYMQELYKLGRFDEMVNFTSSGTISKFGKDKVLSFYKEVNFAYKMKLKSQNISGDTTVLNYEAGIMATKNMIRIKIVIENDSCKIVLDNLRKF